MQRYRYCLLTCCVNSYCHARSETYFSGVYNCFSWGKTLSYFYVTGKNSTSCFFHQNLLIIFNWIYFWISLFYLPPTEIFRKYFFDYWRINSCGLKDFLFLSSSSLHVDEGTFFLRRGFQVLTKVELTPHAVIWKITAAVM